MDIHLIKYPDGTWRPNDDLSHERNKKLPAGHIETLDAKKKRRAAFHRKGFALVNFIFENQDEYEDIEQFRVALKIRVGCCDYYEVDGRMVGVPRSWKFSEMDDLEFDETYQKIITYAIENVCCGDEAFLNQILGGYT